MTHDFIWQLTEPDIVCENCKNVKPVGDMVYDEHAEIYYCDRECFDHWHDANAEIVGDYYYRMNVEY